VKISFTLTDSPLGQLLLAATERGLCLCSLAKTDPERLLQKKYPAADIERDDARMKPFVQPLLRHLSGEQQDLDLPLDVQGTDFERRVWRELRTIPYGTTRSYQEVARRINRPRAYRAVGHACATNPVAVVVPCHRVIRSDGGLGGFGWGLKVKEKLLEQENALNK
jgi:AraC family transcriptional regulator of adaptative response/methylated-DNA-[protein]-cysteine methyltransferase